MIHDVLLSCLNLYSPRLPLEEFILSDAAGKFLHPCEKQILQDIIDIINLLRDVAKFAKIYGSNQSSTTSSLLVDADEPLQSGLYLVAFANGIDQVLDEYYSDITDLERRYLQNPSQSLLFIYQALQVYQPLAMFMRKLIRDVRTQRLHGCAIMQYIHKNMQHGDKRISRCIKTIQSSVNVVFLKQLTHWILYAKLSDCHGEFFIVNAEARYGHNSTVGSERGATTSKPTGSDSGSINGSIWSYGINGEQLPHYLPYSWAEKVLFIGQTVMIFKRDAYKSRDTSTWDNSHENVIKDEESLWNEKEHIYFGRIQALLSEELNVSNYERVIDDIKGYVSMRLSELALNQADLVQQLKLIKDFYLLARGELYYEFIQQLTRLKHEEDDAHPTRYINRAFESAANSLGIVDELERFPLVVPKTSADAADESTASGDAILLPHMELHYKITWPLHLLFSPLSMSRYNQLFRFLLLIKKIQLDLHMVWHAQTKQEKLERTHSTKIMQLRNQLMFFIDHLQYYIQVDVLESQFSILMTVIQNKADFDQIKCAHSHFQAEVFSLCFLKPEDEFMQSEESIDTHPTVSPVQIILNDIFHLCDEFCSVVAKPREDVRQTIDVPKEIDKLDDRFNVLMDQLIYLLISLRNPSQAPLAQLLLRLDFNHWFSMKKVRESEC